ncbi:tudor domain-containing protein 7A isoform X2 [Halichoeres trimaculatus]|uniref:tudor domain-containing protein 7A isoform X2 n=1 Tax=Halichoeres trimaculatus TaxID=147232 RepID=UPI003D9DE58A
MSDSESVKRILRSVLQSCKAGVPVGRLQSEYRSLCGEFIPLKRLGFSKLEDYLWSIPSIVRLENYMGEIRCFAVTSRETVHIAELVARQKSSKKSGPSRISNCRMSFKNSNPYMLNKRPRSLRQPFAGGVPNRSANRNQAHGGSRGFSASGDYRQKDQRLSTITPVEHRPPASQPASQPAPKPPVAPQSLDGFPNFQQTKDDPPQNVSRMEQSQSCQYDVGLVQSRMTQLLRKYSSGVWLSKLSGVYRNMFGTELHPQVLVDLEKWTLVCLVDKPSSTSTADPIIYPPLPPQPPTNTPLTSSSTVTTPVSPRPSTASEHPSPDQTHPPTPKPRISPKNISPSQPAAGVSVTPPSVPPGSPAPNPALAPRCVTSPSRNMPSLAPTWTAAANKNTPPLLPDPDVLPLLKVTFRPSSDPDPHPPPQVSDSVLPVDVREKLKKLLSKYSHGLWAQGLPKLFMDTFKTPFPDHVLSNLSLLLDICDVEYPVPGDKTKAILYNSSRADTDSVNKAGSQQIRSYVLPSGVDVLSSVIPPPLDLPTDQYRSVLVTDSMSGSVVTLRYVGENYSDAQEAMEDTMLSFYTTSPQRPVNQPVVGQLVAVRGDDEEGLVRAQVIEITAPDKIKVYYVDYGFSVETSGTALLELHRDFLSLPFQATTVKLAGLEAFSTHPQLLASLEKLAVGKILLMETLEPSDEKEMPQGVLYDTSLDDDLNINAACLKDLQDKTMNNPLTVNTTYKDVRVTNVSADGIIYCQLPSRGSARLRKLLEDTEAIFNTKMTPDLLVSRPFTGKLCLAQYKGQWSRAEITNMHSNRVMEILFIDLGVKAALEVTALREIPPVFMKDFILIPSQVIKCRLAGLIASDEHWSQELIDMVKEAVMGALDCRIKIFKLEQHNEDLMVFVHLFIGTDGEDLDKCINHQLALTKPWLKFITKISNMAVKSNSSGDTGLCNLMEGLTLSPPVLNQIIKAPTDPILSAEHLSIHDQTTIPRTQNLPMPPPLELPQPGQNMDVFIPVACHPGYFILQPWQDLHKLVVLMEEMILYYHTWKSNTAMHIEKGEVYAARINNNWHRVQVKGILTNGLVSVFELDYGKHELVRSTLFQPLIEEFRQLPFQAVIAQLAGLTQTQWSEEASMLFRNHVEERALVAHVESVQEAPEGKGQLWERKLTVYLVDTTLEEKDLWIHCIIADLCCEQSSAA